MKLKRLNVLLADDDTDDCIFFKQALAELLVSTHLIEVHDGEQLMQLLSSEGNELPDVLFLDLNMPRKNGFECLSEIKLNPVLKQLPVIIFSASFEQDVVNRLHENGAQYFMRKPSEFSQFKKIIQQTITMVSENLPFGVEGDLTQPTKEKFVITVQGNLIG